MRSSSFLIFLTSLISLAPAVEHEFLLDPWELAQNRSDVFHLRFSDQMQWSNTQWVDLQFASQRSENCDLLGVQGDCSLREMHMELGWKPMWHGMSAEPLVHLGYLSKYEPGLKNKDSLYRNYYTGLELRLSYQYRYGPWVFAAAVGAGQNYLGSKSYVLLRPVFGLGWHFGSTGPNFKS